MQLNGVSLMFIVTDTILPFTEELLDQEAAFLEECQLDQDTSAMEVLEDLF